MKNRNIPFSPPDIQDDDIEEVVETLRSGWITTGRRVKEFENGIASYTGSNRAVALGSATAALELTLRILGVGPGDEVITTAYTYTASASVVNHVGAKLVLVDIYKGTFEIDYDALSQAITEKTKVIIPVDIGGRMCDYKKIYDIVNEKAYMFCAGNDLQKIYNRIIVVADGAHSFGAYQFWNGKKVCSGQAADFTTFSFHAVKNLTTAEGGAVVWKRREGLDDSWLYQQYSMLSLHGQSKDAYAKNQLGAWEYDIVTLAYKCNMTDIQAAVGLHQLKRYTRMLERRKEIIQRYDEAFLRDGVSSLRHFDTENHSSGHLYLLSVTGMSESRRNDMIVHLAQEGVATNVHYKPLPMMTAYKELGFDIVNYPNAYEQYVQEISLPLHTCLSDEDVEYVVQKVSQELKEI